MRTIWCLWADYGDYIPRLIFCYTSKEIAERQEQSYGRIATRLLHKTIYWVTEGVLVEGVQP
jgi:hypothetical protein